VAALLHFTFLDRPAIWIDDAMTFRRVTGTYRQMLGELHADGFGPLHYQAYWLLARYELLTPTVMRLVPAAAGTLFVPAIYFLARQLFVRRTALVAAALAACSACVFVYSRDAKMYMHGWLFVALHVGGLMWWLRTGRSTAWLVWVAAGVAMTGTLTVAAVVLAVEPLLALTARRVTWGTAVLFVLGLLIVAAGPVGHFTYFTDYLQQPEPRGIDWVRWRNDDAGGWLLVLDSASCFLAGFHWLTESKLGQTPPAVLKAMTWTAWGIGGMLAVGALPWPWRWRADGIESRAQSVASSDSPPEEASRAGQSPRHVEPQPAWRAWLWLGLLIVVPTYAFYCRSVEGFASPLEWLAVIDEWTRPYARGTRYALLYVLAGLLAVTALVPALRRRFWPLVRWVLVTAALLGVCRGIYAAAVPMAQRAAEDGREWRSVFMPRYLGFALPAVFVATAALLARIPFRPLRWACVGALLAVNLVQGQARIWAGNEPPVNDVAADVWTTPADGSNRVYVDLPDVPGGPGFGELTQGVGRYYAVVWTRGAITHDPVSFFHQKRPPIPSHVEEGYVAASSVAAAARDARVERIVVWTHVDPRQPNPDEVKPALGDAWTLAADRRYRVRIYWTWRELNDWYRREYVRVK